MTGKSAGTVAYVGIGSNLDHPADQVRRALHALAHLPESRLQACSGLYRSAPVGPPNQPDYINAAACLLTRLDPYRLLAALQALENAQGRVRRERWGPRTLDLDLLLHGDHTQDHDPRLILPHPRLQERLFVLRPLSELDPGLVVPGLGAVADLLAACPPLALHRLDDPPEIAMLQRHV